MSTRHTAYVRLRLAAFEMEIKMEKEKRMKRKVSPKHFLTMLLLCILLAVSFQVPSLAACSHSSLGSQYSEAAHPHAYYRTCNSCGQKIYSGGYATKMHGDGSWGSGTCPDCGTHTYGNTYSEAAHPHYYYKTCVCGDVKYTGGHATKTHGDGSWGSGTCPDCGSHTYVGQTCTSPGTCACGAVIAASGHTLNGTTYYESAHPHNCYKLCSKCGYKSYTGSQKTLQHGNGSSGTCSQCGSHDYSTRSDLSQTHPHELQQVCACGSSKTSYSLSVSCSQCSKNMTAAENTESRTFTFFVVESDNDYGAPLSYSGTFSVTYKNLYNNPALNDAPYDYNRPPFASFTCTVLPGWEMENASILFSPTVYTTAHLTADYYSASGSVLGTQSFVYSGSGGNLNAVATAPLPYTLRTKPSYAVAGAGIGAENSMQSMALDVTTYFN